MPTGLFGQSLTYTLSDLLSTKDISGRSHQYRIELERLLVARQSRPAFYLATTTRHYTLIQCS